MHNSRRSPPDTVRWRYTYLKVVTSSQGVHWDEAVHSAAKTTIARHHTLKNDWRLRMQELASIHCVHGRYLGLSPAGQRPLSLSHPSLERNLHFGRCCIHKCQPCQSYSQVRAQDFRRPFVVRGFNNCSASSTTRSLNSDLRPTFLCNVLAGWA